MQNKQTDEKGRPITYWGGKQNTTQTAVEWLIDWIGNNQYFIGDDLLQAFKQAKQMEKEQIKEAYIMGELQQGFEAEAEQYYNETYGSNNQI